MICSRSAPAMSPSQLPQSPFLPTHPTSIVRQAATAVSRAFVEGALNRQTVRLPLSDSMYGDKEEGFVADRAIGWQGGPQETFRFLSPMASDLLRQIRVVDEIQTGGLPPRIKEQVLLDFDGSALLTAESPAGPLGDVQALIQPNTDGYYLDTVASIEELFSDSPGKARRLFILVNPAWRDRSSWGFFGGKRAQELILDRYETTYALDQFVVRGQKVSLLKTWPDDWCVFLTPLDADQSAKLLGTFPDRPDYSEMDKLVKASNL